MELSAVPSVNFLEANTSAISIEELTVNCVVPTWANQELTISHQDFINTVHDAACNVFSGELINRPEIRVSHIVRGRIPSALGKRASELLESEKTQFYQRLAFAFTIPCIHETIDGQRLELCIGGVRNYNDLNLYRANRGAEKFSVFIGWRMNVCSNQVLTAYSLDRGNRFINLCIRKGFTNKDIAKRYLAEQFQDFRQEANDDRAFELFEAVTQNDRKAMYNEKGNLMEDKVDAQFKIIKGRMAK